MSATTCFPEIASAASDTLLLPQFVDTINMSASEFEGWLIGAPAFLAAATLSRGSADLDDQGRRHASHGRGDTVVGGRTERASSIDEHTEGPTRPFFQTPPNPSATRRMLLVFFYFVPSGEVGALRWLSLARFGAARGWALDVVMLHPKYMDMVDLQRLDQLANGTRMFGFSGREPAWYRALASGWRVLARQNTGQRVAGIEAHSEGGATAARASPVPGWRLRLRTRLQFLLDDALTQRAVALGSALAQANRYDVVVSSGPPHSCHMAAREVARSAGLPFVMDMRDPWSDDSAMPEKASSAVWKRTTRVRERAAVDAARLVVVTSTAHEALQIRKYPSLRGRVATVMNGADSDPLPASRTGRRFVIAFAGMIYLGRNPRVLFRAAARVAREAGATPEEFGVEFMGDDACEGIPLPVMADQEGLGDFFRSYAFRPRLEALEFLSGASVLVSLPLRTAMTLPAKLFEYVRFDAWLLVLADEGSAAAELLVDTDADVVAPHDEDAIARVLRRRFEEFRAGRRAVALNHDGRFDRSVQSGRMFDFLDTIAAERGGASRP